MLHSGSNLLVRRSPEMNSYSVIISSPLQRWIRDVAYCPLSLLSTIPSRLRKSRVRVIAFHIVPFTQANSSTGCQCPIDSIIDSSTCLSSCFNVGFIFWIAIASLMPLLNQLSSVIRMVMSDIGFS